MKIQQIVIRGTQIAPLLVAIFAGDSAAQLPPPPQPVATAPVVIRQSPQISFGAIARPFTNSSAPLPLTLRDAIRRGLDANLAVLTGRDTVEAASLERRRVLASFLPDFSIGATQTSQQLDLVAFGFSAPGFPAVVGPFGYENIRAYYHQTLYNKPAKLNMKSIDETRKEAEFSAADARNLVVQSVSNAYLAVTTERSRIDFITQEVAAAKLLYDRAADQKAAGVAAGIDVLRADVQLKSEQQRLLAEQNQLEKANLALGRLIGLPGGAEFSITDSMSYSPLAPPVEELLAKAWAQRDDIHAVEASIRAAELAVQSAKAEHHPTVVVEGDYGDIGSTLAHSHGTYSLLAGVRFPIYSGGRSQIDEESAQLALRNRKNALEDLRGRVEYEIRNALADLKSSADQVSVAKSNVDLANQTLAQARDRFGAGVTDNIEAIQAQQLLAQTNETYVATLNAHNAAKIALATALGAAEQSVPEYLGLK